MRVEHVPATQRPASNNCLPSSRDLNLGGDEFGQAIRWRAERRHRVAGSISWQPPAFMALLGILALTAACGTSVKAPSGDGSQPSLVSENKAERVPDRKTYGNLHVTRFIDSEGVFNPTPVAVRARRPSSTTAFVRDTPEPGAAVPRNVADLGPAGP